MCSECRVSTIGIKYATVVVWAIGLMAATGYLMSAHWIVLPSPAIGQHVEMSSSDEDRWHVLHVLYLDCPCSRRIAVHLEKRQAKPECDENVILVADNHPISPIASRLTSMGFQVETCTRQQLLQKHGIESSPLLLVTDASETVVYSGGYTDIKQGPVIRDQEIIDDLIAGNHPTELPVFGCAVSSRLQRQTDPLGWKY